MSTPDLQGAQTPWHPHEVQFNPTEVSAPHPPWGLVGERAGREDWGFGISSIRRKIINAVASVNVTRFWATLFCFHVSSLHVSPECSSPGQGLDLRGMNATAGC